MTIATNWPGRSSGNWGLVPAAFGEALEARQFEVELDCGFPGYSLRRNNPDAAVASAAAARLTVAFRRAVGILVIRIWRTRAPSSEKSSIPLISSFSFLANTCNFLFSNFVCFRFPFWVGVSLTSTRVQRQYERERHRQSSEPEGKSKRVTRV
jgi:hypothetical protein